MRPYDNHANIQVYGLLFSHRIRLSDHVILCKQSAWQLSISVD
jgi:hypothetical protein